MNIWHLSPYLLFQWILSSDSQRVLSKHPTDYTYYFETDRYVFPSDHFHSNDENAQNLLSQYGHHTLHPSVLDFTLDTMTVHISYSTNTSSYSLTLNNNISLDFDYDRDWNEIESLRYISSPLSDGDNDHFDFFDMDIPEMSQMADSIESIESSESSESTPHSQRRRLFMKSTKMGRYIGIPDPRSFGEAERVCRDRFGGELASIRTSTENRIAAQLCSKLSNGDEDCWIGLRKPFQEWTDGRKTQFDHWADTEPNHPQSEFCAVTDTDGGWASQKCKKSYPFLCETARNYKQGKYIGIGMALSWDNANEYCYRRFGTELATISSDTDNQDVRNVCNHGARKRSCYIGLERYFHETFPSKLSTKNFCEIC